MAGWSAERYLKFRDERTRPAQDLLAQVAVEGPRRVFDLGCGPGNSTELLVARYPDAEVVGVDSSADMLARARERLPRCKFIQANLAAWEPADCPDVLFSNAAFQWVPNHQPVLRRLVQTLRPGGIFAAQIGDIGGARPLALMQEIAEREPWVANPALRKAVRAPIPSVESYYDLLKPLSTGLDIWRTFYHHPLASAEAIVEWFKGSALQPFLAAVEPETTEDFLAAYTAEIARHHRPRVDGQVLLILPRLFIVATR
jgi:trans-aconitate 2-methyltransferase